MATSSSDAAWREWSETDPYFGVLTLPEYRRDKLEENRDAFFRTGEEHVADVIAEVRHLGVEPSGRVLDFGCGVGRLLVPFSRIYDHVTGVDIAPAMLAESRRNLTSAGARSFDLVLSDDQLSSVEGSYDLVHTTIVLQHIPVRRGYTIIHSMLAKTRPGGAFYLHITFDRPRTLIGRLTYGLRKSFLPAHWAANLLKGQRVSEPLMEMNEYDFVAVARLLHAAGVTRFTTRLICEGDMLSAAFIGIRPA